jgi:molybdate transport system substrate-binding protein
MRRARASVAVCAGAVLMFTATACGDAGDDAGGEVAVLAAASLTEVFTELGEDFEAAHPGTAVTFSFAGSSQLAQQVVNGAPADVFAAASPATMKTVTDAGAAAGPPRVFVRNQLVIAVPRGNPDRIAALADLARPGLKVAVCAPQVPCGAAAGRATAAARVALAPVTQEQDVKAALAKLRLGEVDAALVYRTDAAAAADDVTAVEFPESAAAVNDYPIAALRDGPNATGGAAFVEYVLTDPRARATLTDAGFLSP